jgi:hypothetical protein
MARDVDQEFRRGLEAYTNQCFTQVLNDSPTRGDLVPLVGQHPVTRVPTEVSYTTDRCVLDLSRPLSFYYHGRGHTVAYQLTLNCLRLLPNGKLMLTFSVIV